MADFFEAVKLRKRTYQKFLEDALPPLDDDPTIPFVPLVELCSRCQKIDFSAINVPQRALDTWDLRRLQGVFVMNLEASFEQLASSDCALCRLFGSMKPLDPFISKKPGPCHLRSFSAKGQYFPDRDRNEMRGLQDSLLLGVVDFAEDDLWRTPMSLDTIGFLCPINLAQPKPSLSARRLHMNTIDFEFIKECMFNCSKFHRATCEASSHTSVNLRVLNCLSRQVVKAPSNCRYIALSYVWSQSPPGQSEADNSVDTAALQNVPKVIEDSIELALRLGYLYLWVDRYCIDQTNAEAKHDQIRQMDLVYAEARLTIIAAADGDGLPGLRNSFREAQPALRVGDWTLLSTMAHPRDAVEKSKWITRGWTYQEGLLSRRRLLYTNDQVTYECNADSCSESVVIPRNNKSSSPWHFGEKLPRSAFEYKHPGEDPSDFMKYVSEFYERKLSYAADTLNAMEGIFRLYSKSEEATHVYLGIPIAPPDVTENNRLGHTSDTAKNSFLKGLSWAHSKTGKRQPQFPSWTWAGWTGGSLESNLLFSHRRVSWEVNNVWNALMNVWIEDEDGKRRGFPGRKLNKFLSQHKDSYQYIHIESPVAQCDIVQLTNAFIVSGRTATWPEAEEDRVNYYGHASFYARFPDQNDRQIIWEMHPDAPITEDSIDKTLALMIGGVDWNDNFDAFVILLEDKGDHYERIGILSTPIVSWIEKDRIGMDDDVIKEWWKRTQTNTPKKRLRIG